MSLSLCLRPSLVCRAATDFKVDQSNSRPSSLSTYPQIRSRTARGSLNTERKVPS